MIDINLKEIRKQIEKDLGVLKDVEGRVKSVLGRLDAFQELVRALESLGLKQDKRGGRKAAAKKTATKKAVAKKTTTKKAAVKKTTPKKAVAKKAAPKKAVAKKTAPKKAVAKKKAAPKKAVAKKTAPKKAVAKKTAPKKAAPKKAVAKKRPGAPKGQIRSPKVRAMVDVLKDNGGPMSPQDVEAALAAKGIVMAKGTVAATLARLPQVEKKGRGIYQYVG